MLFDRPDKTWEEFGQKDPYYGVLSVDAFRGAALSDATLKEFFASGQAWVAHLERSVLRQAGIGFPLDTAIDFGCGTGRVALALADVSRRVIALDVSPAYLAIARTNAQNRNLANLEFLPSPAGLAAIPDGSVQLFHSCLVFQHIPVKQGLVLIDQSLSKLAVGGAFIVQLPIAAQGLFWRNLAKSVLALAPLRMLFNALAKRPAWQRPMQMNVYELGTLLRLFSAHRIAKVSIETHADGAFVSATICGIKGDAPGLHPSAILELK